LASGFRFLFFGLLLLSCFLAAIEVTP
jgi:hypothetical protein